VAFRASSMREEKKQLKNKIIMDHSQTHFGAALY
jgi:hypothetical protein